MRYFAVSDNEDTLTGLRLVGIEGAFANDGQSAERAIKAALADRDIGILIVTDTLAELCRGRIYEIMATRISPLVVEIPAAGSHGGQRTVSKILADTVGIEL